MKSHDNQGSDNTSLTAVSNKANKPAWPVCSNCECPGHKAEFCIQSGGQMAGKTLDEAHAAQVAQKATAGKTHGNRTTASQSTASQTPATQPQPQTGNAKSIMVNGKYYMLVNNTANTASVPINTVDTNTALAAVLIPMPAYNQDEYMAVLATDGDLHTSLNWDNTIVPALVCTTWHTISAQANDLPFILDTGATCHISPVPADFRNLRSIPRHPVKGLGSSTVYATGMGNIEICIAGGHTLKLIDTLYIPESNVRLISIMALNKCGNYTTHFNSNGCWVTNKSNTTLVHEALSTSKRLYVLTTTIPSLQSQERPASITVTMALYTRVPDIETWHQHLGHCNTRSIIDMAKNGVTQGMPIDLSSLPANCDHCALGKQSHSSVPKIWEGPKANRRLGRVYADLCGPMAVTSRTGNMYAMNIIDDFSGYVWSIPL